MCEKQSTSITENELLKRQFQKLYNTHIFNVIPGIVYRKDYTVKGDLCPLFIVYYSGEFCHVVPAFNALGCAFVPIKTTEKLDLLISVLSECTETDNNCSSK